MRTCQACGQPATVAVPRHEPHADHDELDYFCDVHAGGEAA